MARIAIVSPDKAEITARGKTAVRAETRAYFRANSDPLHLHLHRLERGGRLPIASGAIDRAIFIWRGAANLGGHWLEAGSSAIVERGAEAEIETPQEGCELLVFEANPDSASPKRNGGGHVRVLPRADVPRYGGLLGDNTIGGAMHADSTSPTCAVWLHENFLPAASGGEPLVHSHTVNEIIFVTDGEMQFGSRRLGPGTALAIAAHAFYSFVPAPTGLAFVNFRASKPGDIRFKKGGSIDEVGFWRAQTGTPRPITLGAA